MDGLARWLRGAVDTPVEVCSTWIDCKMLHGEVDTHLGVLYVDFQSDSGESNKLLGGWIECSI